MAENLWVISEDGQRQLKTVTLPYPFRAFVVGNEYILIVDDSTNKPTKVIRFHIQANVEVRMLWLRDAHHRNIFTNPYKYKPYQGKQQIYEHQFPTSYHGHRLDLTHPYLDWDDEVDTITFTDDHGH